MSDPYTASPVNPIPPVVLVLVGAMAVVEAVFQLGTRGIIGGPGAVGWRLGALQDYAFSGEVWDWMVANGRWPPEQVARLVTYPFLHASFTHALFVIVFLLALGKMVAENFHWLAVLAVFFVSAVAGALVFSLVPGEMRLLIGGFPPVYGMIGAFTFLLWTRLAAAGAQQSRAFLLIAVLMGAQLIFALFFGAGNDWVADLAGFGAGFAMSFVVSPGGWARVVDKLRQR